MAEVILVVCDVHAKQDQRVEATETIRLVINDRPLRVDLCAEHAGELGRVINVIDAVGTEETPKSKRPKGSRSNPSPRKSGDELINSPGATGCPLCYKLLSTPGNAGHHVRKIHLRKMEEFTEEERSKATREARLRARQGIEPRHLSLAEATSSTMPRGEEA